jgi:hypothetical protein
MKINPNKIKTRDHLLVKVITGTTKAGIHKDRKKDLNKKKCRAKVSKDSE